MAFFDWLLRLLVPRERPSQPVPPQQSERAPLPSDPSAPSSAPETLTRSTSDGSELDAGAFLPITRAELKKEAGQLRGWGAWFGRRDLIPPVNDPRTALIDRAMVTHGMLSPEELEEIHSVGDQWEEYRPSLESAQRHGHAAGEAAIAADRREREKVKERKKAEAAQRKKRRAEEIERRRQTDIQFLGRNVSHRLHLRDSDVEKLTQLDLPVLSTPADVAQAMGLTISRLRWLAFHTDVAERVHYVQFTVPKKSGGERVLSAPHRSLAGAQRWIFDHVLSKLPVEECAHGFAAGRGIVTNARPHAGRDIIVNVDLENFFPSITWPRVVSVFERIGYSPCVATIFALLCTECPRRVVRFEDKPYHVALGPRGLPQGACTSPALSNQVARRLDRRFLGLARKLGIVYTRYADDLTFSANHEFQHRVGYLLARIRHVAQDERFAVNEKKTRVLRPNTAQIVTGLVVNDKPTVRRSEIRRLRAIVHRAGKEGLAAQNRADHPQFEAWLRGKIAYVAMTRPEIAAKLLADLNKSSNGS